MEGLPLLRLVRLSQHKKVLLIILITRAGKFGAFKHGNDIGIRLANHLPLKAQKLVAGIPDFEFNKRLKNIVDFPFEKNLPL